MSDTNWDDDDFEPTVVVKPKPFSDKWEGEDEDDDVKDSWDKDSSSEGEDDSKGSEDSSKAFQRKKKKKMADIIAEKEAAKLLEMEEQAKAKAEQEAANTPEGKKAEKERQREIQELENLQQARDLMGLRIASGIDSMSPNSKDEFNQFSKAIVEKVQLFNTSSYYPDFVEELIKDLSLDLPAPTLKKIKIHVETLHSTKLKEEKASKGKKGGKKGSSVKMDLEKDLFGTSGGGAGFDDMDDFM